MYQNGVTDKLYVTGRRKNYEAFKILFDSALSRKECIVGRIVEELEEQLNEGVGISKNGHGEGGH